MDRVAMSALIRAGIFTREEMATMESAMARIAIVLMGCRLVAENLPEILDSRLKDPTLERCPICGQPDNCGDCTHEASNVEGS